MKLATVLAMAFVLVCSVAALASTPMTQHEELSLEQQKALKQANISGIHDPQINAGGEDIGSAANIPALPYSDGGNTCSFLNDYDEVCPYTGSTSGDAVYKHTPGSNIEVDISICGSTYDTKVYVYENSSATVVACNDDACGSTGFQSELECVPMTAGNTYYIVVDGWGGDCGTYDLQISECTPCIVSCPSGGVLEGEPTCFDGYNDNFNGGCNSVPPVFSPIPCNPNGLTICGEYGGFFHPQSGFDYRDTDWYDLPSSANSGGVVMSVTGELDTLLGYIDASSGCPVTSFENFAIVGPCEVGVLPIATLGPKFLFVATAGFGAAAGPCGSKYTLAIDGLDCPPVSVEAKSWAEIKAGYREE